MVTENTTVEKLCDVCEEMPASVLREENGVGIAACEGCGQDIGVEDDAFRRAAVAAEVGCSYSDVGACLNENEFRYGSQTYLVLTNEEADEACADRVRDSLWAFNADFIAQHTQPKLSNAARNALSKVQRELCEDAGPLVEALIHDMDAFVESAVSADGRGHFLATYDGEEREQGEFFLYRQ